METFNYLVGLVSIVVGLALTEIASGLNRVLRGRHRPVDPLVLGSALLIALMLVSSWFDFWAIRQVQSLFGFPFFLLVFFQLLLFYLLAAACIPPAEDGGVASYEANRRFFWRLFLVYQLFYFGLWIFFQTAKGLGPLALAQRSLWQTGEALPVLITIVLVTVRYRAVHAVGIALMIVQIVASYWNYRIG